MKISELSRQSDTPIPTIKFYIRRGLLPAGESVARNQAAYDETHLDRLDLISRLKEYAGLSIDTIAAVLDAATTQPNSYAAMGAGMEAASEREGEVAGTGLALTSGQKLVRQLARKNNWPLAEKDPTLLAVARAFDRAEEGWPFEVTDARIDRYVEIIFQLAELEIEEDWGEGLNPDSMLKFAILGTFIFEPLILALRRTAHRVRMVEAMNAGLPEHADPDIDLSSIG